MAADELRSLSELLSDKELVNEAISDGVRQALLAHARAGNSVPVSRDGNVEWLTPDEIYERLGLSSAGRKAS